MHVDETSGTATFGNGIATVSVMVVPGGTCVRGSLSCASTVPSGFELCLSVRWTASPNPSSFDFAASYWEPTTSGTTTTDGWFLLLIAFPMKYPAAARSAKISSPIRTPSQTLREEPSPSGGGSTWVGDGRAITWVASPPIPAAISGVASTSWPCLTRSRSAESSSAVW